MRSILLLGALALTAACRPYDLQSPLVDQDGLVPAAKFAKYGAEQAKVIQIGRALGQWDGGTTPEARATQVTKAADYARTLPGVETVTVDTLGYRLTVRFASGWRTAVLPIRDGVAP